MELLTLGAIRQLCVVGSYLACAVARARESEAVAYAFESAAKSIEGVGELHGTTAPPVVQRIARRQIKRIEDGCEKWLASDLGANWRKNQDAEAMLAALEDVLPACLPGPDGLATEDIVPGRIVEAALIRAAALDPKDPTFVKGGIGHSVLRSLLARSIADLEQDAEFRELLQLSGLRELLRRSREQEQAAERRHRELLEAIARQKGVEIPPLQAILVKLGEARIPDYEIPTRLDAAADELIALRAQLARLTNDRPEFASIRGQALAHIDQGEFDEARAALGRGRKAARALREDVSRNEAEFLADEALIDHLQLAYKAAAEKYSQAAGLVASFDRNAAWNYFLKQAGELYAQGKSSRIIMRS
jgi:hypothetical protein